MIGVVHVHMKNVFMRLLVDNNANVHLITPSLPANKPNAFIEYGGVFLIDRALLYFRRITSYLLPTQRLTMRFPPTFNALCLLIQHEYITKQTLT